MVIKRVTIGNFKCIKELDLELAPLTIFVGPNGSGKSSILEAIALMSQSAKRGIPARRDDAVKGELINYDGLRSVLYKGLEGVELSLGVTLSIGVGEVGNGIERDLENFSELIRHHPSYEERLSTFLDFLRGLQRKKEIEVSYVYRANGLGCLHSFTIDGPSLTFGYDSSRGKFISEPEGWGLRGGDAFVAHFTLDERPSEFSFELTRAVKKRLSRVYYLSVERGSIPWEYLAGEKPEWVGKKGEYTLAVIAELMKPEYEEKRLPYQILCEKFGIKNVWVGWDRHSYLTSRYVDPLLGSVHKLPSLGHGSRQLLPVIAQLAYSEPGSVILVEEPEISLHPSYQRLLPVLFGMAVNEGKQVLVTTHSSYFPLSLDLVLRGEGFLLEGRTAEGLRSYRVKLSTKDVIVYHVTRDEEGSTKVERLELDEEGLKEGIPSFVEVEKEILGRFISGE